MHKQQKVTKLAHGFPSGRGRSLCFPQIQPRVPRQWPPGAWPARTRIAQSRTALFRFWRGTRRYPWPLLVGLGQPQRSLQGPRWGQLLMICPIWRTIWTRCSDVSIAWTYLGDVSISTSFLNMFCLAAAQRERMAQAAKLDQLIWANLEEIGYGH